MNLRLRWTGASMFIPNDSFSYNRVMFRTSTIETRVPYWENNENTIEIDNIYFPGHNTSLYKNTMIMRQGLQEILIDRNFN